MSSVQQPRLQHILQAIDDCNRQDPNNEMVGQQSMAKELVYSQRMSQRLASFCPQASEALQIAARAQHIERWTISRQQYPEGRQGYKQWRTELARYHASRTGELMQQAGYVETDIARVSSLLQKKFLKQDAEVQALEDVICLVFIEHYLEAFANKHDEDKLIDIIRKTWAKMSEAGQQAALQLPLNDAMLALVTKALAT